jgi:hypothetical protein
MKCRFERSFIAIGMLIILASSVAIGACVLKAVNDAATTDKTMPITISVLSNDQYVTPNTIVRAVMPASHGKTAIGADRKTVIYYPNGCGCGPCNPNYCGPDKFTYVIMDPANPTCTSTATVYITITCGCDCQAKAPDITICQGTALSDQLFLSKGAGCSACDITPVLDYSNVQTSTPGPYTYKVTCSKPGCSPVVATGTVTVLAACKANAPTLTVCQGTKLTTQMFIDNGAGYLCIGNIYLYGAVRKNRLSRRSDRQCSCPSCLCSHCP